MNNSTNKLKQGPLRVSNPKVLIGLSFFLLLIGGMVIDPQAGFLCFAVSGIISFIAVLSGTGRTRYMALLLLIIVTILAISKFHEARNHHRTYRSGTITGSAKS